MLLFLCAQATVYGRRDPVVNVKIIEDTVRWKLEEFHDAQSGFANLTDSALGDKRTQKVVEQHLEDAEYVPKPTKKEE